MHRHALLLTTIFFATLTPGFAAHAASADNRALKALRVAEAGEHRVALVIGNGQYKDAPLKNPANDARAVAKSLRALGFDVIERVNTTQKEMNRAITEFGARLRQDSVALFYYAGHGMQAKGRNYLVPVDAEINSESSIKSESVDVDSVVEQLAGNNSGLNFVILDACRNNPYERKFRSSGGSGLVQMDAPKGTLIAYSTAPGRTASDGTGDNGIYTQELLKVLPQRGLRVEEVFKRVRVAVARITNDNQLPWESSSLTGDFYFVAPEKTAAVASEKASEPADQNAYESEVWNAALKLNNREAYAAYLETYPKGRFAALARAMVATREAETKTAAQAAAQESDVWKAAQQLDSSEGYQAYIDEFPSGKFLRVARASLKKARERETAPAAPQARVAAPAPGAATIQLASAAPSADTAKTSALDLLTPLAGDVWTYEITDLLRGRDKVKGEFEIKVDKAEAGAVRESFLSEGERSSSSWLPDTPSGKINNIKLRAGSEKVDFLDLNPYELHRQLTSASPVLPSRFNIAGNDCSGRAGIVGRERITTPAGIFDTRKVELSCSRMFSLSVNEQIKLTLWYLPNYYRPLQIRKEIIGHKDRPMGEQDIFRLVKVSRNGEPVRLASAMPAAVVAKEPLPDRLIPHAGDVWAYDITDLLWNKDKVKGEFEIKVDKAEAGAVRESFLSEGERSSSSWLPDTPAGRINKIVLRAGSEKIDFLDLNPYELHRQVTSASPVLPGRFTIAGSDCSGRASIVGRERITTPAGVFDTQKVELSCSRMYSLSVNEQIKLTLWYSPTHYRPVQIRKEIIGHKDRPMGERDIFRLVKFTKNAD